VKRKGGVELKNRRRFLAKKTKKGLALRGAKRGVVTTWRETLIECEWLRETKTGLKTTFRFQGLPMYSWGNPPNTLKETKGV